MSCSTLSTIVRTHVQPLVLILVLVVHAVLVVFAVALGARSEKQVIAQRLSCPCFPPYSSPRTW